jgi:hypothetical protein
MVKLKDYTSIGVSKEVKKKLQNLKQYPRETDNDVLIKLIKGEINADDSKSADSSN